MKPGADFGPILKKCLEAQLDGIFDDLISGLDFLEKQLPIN
jgi:hypothetical protein